MTTSEHLAHLLKMLAPPFTENYKAWAWDRAKEIAKDPEHAELPKMLAAAMTSTSTPTSGTPAESLPTGR